MTTRRKRPSRNPAHRAISAGLKIEAAHKHHASIPALKPGQHLWTVLGLWRVTNPGAAQHHLDVENLLTIEGPGCYLCEQPWTPGAELRPCPGDPADQP